MRKQRRRSDHEISSLWPSSMTVQPGLCRIWSETPNTGFLITRPISCQKQILWSELVDTTVDLSSLVERSHVATGVQSLALMDL